MWLLQMPHVGGAGKRQRQRRCGSKRSLATDPCRRQRDATKPPMRPTKRRVQRVRPAAAAVHLPPMVLHSAAPLPLPSRLR
ncbi:hypothetical protein Xazr_04860 [Xanthomonas campestris pv. azadirachtae]|nr:hypothetical protein Xazr_04860 [Xanthomonas campestris pv. azadirachtae]